MPDLAVGLMSGTSLDGIDAALVRFSGERPDVELLAFETTPYPEEVRRRLRAATGDPIGSRELALLHVEVGRRSAEGALRVCERAGVRTDDLGFAAMHGQTVWHEPGVASLQIGDPAVVAERLGATVVSDFRSRDVAAGGQGAPLVPVADARLFASADHARALLNIGGMANVTWVPPCGGADPVVAFDTGPGVALMDALVHATSGAPYDEDGVRAARGTALHDLVALRLADPYFAAAPPKSTGRERFGDTYALELMDAVRARGGSDDDGIATALEFTVRSVADQCTRWLPPDGWDDLVVSGGGARNPTLMARLRAALPGCRVVPFSEVFFDGDAKEAVAFALLGWLTLRGQAGNVPSATGASGPRVLGRITPP